MLKNTPMLECTERECSDRQTADDRHTHAHADVCQQGKPRPDCDRVDYTAKNPVKRMSEVSMRIDIDQTLRCVFYFRSARGLEACGGEIYL